MRCARFARVSSDAEEYSEVSSSSSGTSSSSIVNIAFKRNPVFNEQSDQVMASNDEGNIIVRLRRATGTEEECDDVIDLTMVDTDNEEDDGVVNDPDMEVGERVIKFTFAKCTRSSRLQLVRQWMSEVIYVSCYSASSKARYHDLRFNLAKRTYVGESVNPFFGNGLFAAEVIQPEEYICLYVGRHMPMAECLARIAAGQNSDYFLYVTKGVVIDGYGVGHGAAMANHSCSPNTRLEHEYMPGVDKAPVGILRATKRIEVGEELETNYGYWDPLIDGYPDLSKKEDYVECRCLKPNCCHVLRLHD